MATSPLPGANILPCLLDRLMDGNPEVRVEASPGLHGITMTQYRDGFLRDLRWLLNTKCHQPDEGLGEFSEVERSVFNFGMPDPAGRSVRDVDIVEIERQIRDAILRFEPRILPETLRVKAMAAHERARTVPNTVGFEIRGTLWASPLPELFHVKTEIDLENGECTF